jgi:hypothetical protein
MELKHADIDRTNSLIEQQLQSIKEKKHIIEDRAKACYEYIIKNSQHEYVNCGMIAVFSQMLDMEFDIQHIPYPKLIIDLKSHAFIVEYVSLLSVAEDVRKRVAMLQMPHNLYKEEFRKCKEIVGKYVCLLLSISLSSLLVWEKALAKEWRSFSRLLELLKC